MWQVAQQWLGSLVTPAWWTDLWISEGFANYFQYLAMDAMFPEYKIWKQFSIRELQPALQADSLSTTHPLNLGVLSYEDLSLLFDEVTLRKGASVMRQLTLYLENSVTKVSFQHTVQHYLARNMYGTMKTSAVPPS